MLLSMTGYGEARHRDDALAVAVELRALNNRYLKVSLRAAEPYNLLEPEIERVVRQTVRRGTIQVTLRCERQSDAADFRLDAVALGSYMQQVRRACASLGLAEPPASIVTALLALPGVVPDPAVSSGDLTGVWPVVERVLRAALDRLQSMRREEGGAMAQEFLEYRQRIANELEAIRARSVSAIEGYRDRLLDRVRGLLKELDVQLDRSDVIREVAVYAERSDIAEEIVRLASHLDQFVAVMEEPDAPGRKLEFVTQEMFREANTIGSKAGDVEISRRVVEMKATLERIRELVQNVE